MKNNIACFDAHFDSICGGCGEAISEGDQIGYDRDAGEYICSDCIEERTS